MALIRLDRLLSDTSREGLTRLVRQARDMSGLADRLRAVLPPEARPHLVAANLKNGGELVLIASSPSWAARLRFEADALLEAAQAAGVEVSRACVKVAKQQALQPRARGA